MVGRRTEGSGGGEVEERGVEVGVEGVGGREGGKELGR